MALARPPAPRIYYVYPSMAGAVDGWDPMLAHGVAMGFDTVLMPPPFDPGPGRDMAVPYDRSRLNPALGLSGTVDEGLARMARACREHGLSFMIDLVLDRAAAGSPDAPSTHGEAPPWDATDPRTPPDRATGVAMRLDDPDPERDEALLAWLMRVVGAGVEGFRCIRPHRVPRSLWSALMAAARTVNPRTRFHAWTPGLGFAERQALAGIGFDGAFSSIAWWDARERWLLDEHEIHAAIGPSIGFPEAPFAERLAHPLERGEVTTRRMLRALWSAASLTDGLLVPMGFEFGARERASSRRPALIGFAELRGRPNHEVTDAIREATGFVAAHGSTQQGGAMRLLAGSGAPLTAVLRTQTTDPDRAETARLVVINRDDARTRQMTLRSLGPAVGRFLPFDSTGGPACRLGADGLVTLRPGQTAIFEGRPSQPVLVPPPPIDPSTLADQPRLVVGAVSPSVDEGLFPVKRLVGELVEVEADVIGDGHDPLCVILKWRAADDPAWNERPMRPLGNDRWTGDFPLERIGRHEFTVEAWRNAFAIFRYELQKKVAAGLDVSLEIEEGRLLVDRTSDATGSARLLGALADRLDTADADQRLRILLSDETEAAMAIADPRHFKAGLNAPVPVDAERMGAAFASWYELFPRSQGPDPTRHGTFDDVILRLASIRAMGFNVLYFPPIHPIGRTNRKGRNNTLTPAADDPGSPYAVGSHEGGHDAVHPDLGTLEDFRRLVAAAAEHGLEIALDFAIQCSPDHPWLREHPDWFDWRPDGTIRYAENPPKRYEDIVNVDFYAPGAIPSLWLALRDVVMVWVGEGIRLFRVDNPHTKPLPFWQWMIADVRSRYPDVVFLAEAFTRPKIMYRLAKVGFSQSYTYFTWRNSKYELQHYVQELVSGEAKDFFRPHFFVNTPDINPDFLQDAPRSAFLIRAALATTLSGLWGMYNGFEICEGRPDRTRKEYLDSEKYQIRAWDFTRPGNIVGEIARLNRIRRDNAALQTHLGTRFLPAANDHVLFYEKATAGRESVVLVAVSLDPYAVQDADIELPLWRWNLPDDGTVMVEDLMRGRKFAWTGKMQHIRLDPADMPFSIWRISLPRDL